MSEMAAPLLRRNAIRLSWPAVGAAIVLVAAVVRLALIHTARFTGDESEFYLTVRRIVEGTAFPLLGPPVTGGAARHPGPAFFYLMAPSLLLSKAPEAASAWTALLGAASIGAFWSALRRAAGEAGAALAAGLLAFSPWSVLYGERIWNGNILEPLSLVCLALALKVRERPDSGWVAAFVAALGIYPQFHLSAPMVWLASLAVVGTALRRVNWRWALLGVAIVGLEYVPYLVSELGSDWANMRSLLAEQNFQGRGTGWKYVPLYAFRFLTTDITFHELQGYWRLLPERAAFQALFAGTEDLPLSVSRLVATLLSFALALFAVRAGAREAWRGRGALAAVMRAAGLAIAATMLPFYLTSKPFYPHYAIMIMPFVFTCYAALGREVFAPGTRPWVREASLALAAVYCLGSVAAAHAVSSTLDARNGLATQRAVIERMLADARAESWPPGAVAWIEPRFTSWPDSYEILARGVYETPFHVRAGGPSPYHYVLQRTEWPAPPASNWIGEPERLGPVTLYHVR